MSEKDCQVIKKKYGIKNHFILFVGSLEPRKNLQFLLSIIPELYNNYSIQLVVVGGKGWKSTNIKNIIESSSFPQESTIFCNFVSNEELAMLYNCADCFVSAALMEGLGMPQLEALICGCPVVTAHNSAMIEVAQGKDGAITIKGYNPQDWQQKINEMVNHRKRVNQEQLSEYEWRTVIRRLQNAISNSLLS